MTLNVLHVLEMIRNMYVFVQEIYALLVDHPVNFVTRSGNRVRVRVQCSIYNKVLCSMQWIYYMHNVVYIRQK